MSATTWWRVFAIGWMLALSMLLVFGCGAKEELPKTYSVKGKVVSKSGKPYVAAELTFISLADPELRGYGVTGDDGSFTLDTIALTKSARSSKLSGAVEGEFLVNIRPGPKVPVDPADPPSGRQMIAFTLKKKYKIEPKENNEITVVVE